MSVEKVRPGVSNDPNYMSASGGPLNIQPDRSGAALFEGLANVVGAASQGIDSAIQNRIQRDIYEGYDREIGAQGVDAFTEYQAGSEGTPLDIRPLPASITGKGQSLAKLQQARDEGRISDAYYFGRLNAMVRELRARYPGYREQIDNMVSSVTGVQPANALRRSILQELEESDRQSRAAADEYTKFVWKYPQYLGPFQDFIERGEEPPEAEFRTYVAIRETEMADIAAATTRINFNRLTREQTAVEAADLYTLKANAAVQEKMDIAWGKVQAVARQGTGASAAEKGDLAAAIGLFEADVNMILENLANEAIADGTFSTIVSVEELNRRKDQILRRVETMKNAVTNEQYGILHLDRVVARGIQDKNVLRMLEQFPVFALVQAMNKIGGDQLVNNMFMENPRLKSEMIQAVSTILSGHMATGDITFSEAFNLLKSSGITDPEMYQELFLKNMELIINPEAPTAAVSNTVRAIFEGANGSLALSQVHPDQRRDLFTAFTDPRVVARIATLSPAEQEIYNKKIQEFFAASFHKDITELGRLANEGLNKRLVKDEKGFYKFELTEQGKRLPPNHPDRVRASGGNAFFADPLKEINAAIGMLQYAVKGTHKGDDDPLEQFNRNMDLVTRMGEHAPQPQNFIPESERDPNEEWITPGISPDLQQRIESRVTEEEQQSPELRDTLREQTFQDLNSINQWLRDGTMRQEEYDRARERLEERYLELGGDEADLPVAGATPSMASGTVKIRPDGSFDMEPYSPFEVAEAIGYTDKEREEETNVEDFISIRPTEGSAEIRRARPILNLIAQAEAPRGYNQIFGRNRFAPLDQMTVAQVLQLQRQMVRNGSPSSAVGRYQFINKTLSGLIDRLGIDRNARFTPELQDRLALALLEHRGLSKFLSGQMSARRFQQNLSMEWAGLPSLNGRSYYAGDGLNKATVSVAQLTQALSKLRS